MRVRSRDMFDKHRRSSLEQHKHLHLRRIEEKRADGHAFLPATVTFTSVSMVDVISPLPSSTNSKKLPGVRVAVPCRKLAHNLQRQGGKE